MEFASERFRQHAFNVLAFWRDHAVDRRHGGFIPQLERDGRIYDDTQKHLVPSARLVYAFSQGALLGGPAWCGELARYGFEFLRRHFRDEEHGGWFWAVTRDGTPLDTRKRTYGHDFAILALAEFHRATDDEDALELAAETFDLLDRRVWDLDAGGYVEGFDRTWASLDPPWRTQNSQMHALEAVLALHEVTGRARYRDRVADLCRLMADRLFDRDHGLIPEEFHADWSIDRARRDDRISIGHQFEWAWLLMRAEAALASLPAFTPSHSSHPPTDTRDRGPETVPGTVFADYIRRLMDFACRYGLDEDFGGVFNVVSSEGAVLSDLKGHWENCEALIALLMYARRTGDRRYLDAFERVAAFCFAHLADRECGSWFVDVARDGAPRETLKGGPYKADYHVVQMCAEVCRLLSRQAAV